MEKTILATIVIAFLFIACNADSKKAEEQTRLKIKQQIQQQ